MFRTGQVLANFWSPEFNTLLEDAQTAMDPKKRLEIYAKAGRLFMDEDMAISLYQQIDNYGVNRNLEWAARSDERIEGYNMAWKK
jgi:ABC-type transport system substrate-binding protein